MGRGNVLKPLPLLNEEKENKKKRKKIEKKERDPWTLTLCLMTTVDMTIDILTSEILQSAPNDLKLTSTNLT